MRLVIDQLSKSYGSNKVLDKVSFTFEQGKIYGLLGRNGSGKTTLLSCLDDLLPYEEGSFYLENEDGSREALSDSNIGLVLTEPRIPEFLTGYEFIKAFMEICHIDETDKIDSYFDTIAISEFDRHKLIKEYSMGMKNKLQILMFLILKPKVLLLDEPLTSFDVIVAAEIKNILKDMKDDHIIIFSTHILELATSLCDEIAVLNNRTLSLIDNDKIHDPDFEKTIVEILKNDTEKLPESE